MDANHTPHERRYTVNEAAEILGISAEAVRARMNRGTLRKEKGDDGTVYARMYADHTHPNGHSNGSNTDEHAAPNGYPNDIAFQLWQDQVAFLRRELERKDHLLAMALERIPALEASDNADNADETHPDTETPASDTGQPRRSR